MSVPTTGPALTPDHAQKISAERALRAQSLAQGAAGIALLHTERAHRGRGSWTDAHTVLASCTNDLVVDENASLYVGAPAVAFALHAASVDTGRYSKALAALDTQIIALTRNRLEKAHARIDRGERPRVSEFDLFHGLTGLGSYLLCRDPNADALHGVLAYLVRLTLPLEHDDEQLPGWWTPFDPSGHLSEEFPGGHGNLGMAHGIAGVLSLLALTAWRGRIVDGQTTAMQRICAWLDLHRQQSENATWWPQWITLTEHRTGAVTQPGPLRPGWCYGTPGLARAQQLASLALGDTDRQHMAERALLSCLADRTQLARIRDAGLCHGAAGLLHTTQRVARDAALPGFRDHLPHLYFLLLEQEEPEEDGFLDGTVGRSLALMAAEANGTAASNWDASLLSG